MDQPREYCCERIASVGKPECLQPVSSYATQFVRRDAHAMKDLILNGVNPWLIFRLAWACTYKTNKIITRIFDELGIRGSG